MRKSLSLFLSLVLVFTIFVCTDVTISAETSEVKSISYTLSEPIVLYKNVDGSYITYGMNYKIFLYSYWLFISDNSFLTVNYTDGTSVNYYKKSPSPMDYYDTSDKYYDCNGNSLPQRYELSFDAINYYNWDVGEHEIEVSYLGCYCKVPVTIVENPYSAMNVALVSNIIYSSPQGAGESSYVFDLERHGNVITFTDKTGGIVAYTYDGARLGWYDQYNNRFNHHIRYTYGDTYEPVAGNEFSVTISMGELSTVVYMTTADNPLISFDIGLSKEMVLYENTYCRWSAEKGYMEYGLDDLLPDGSSVTFNYADGTSKIYYFDKANGWLEDANGVIIPECYYYNVYFQQQNPLSVGQNYLVAKISQLPNTAVVPVVMKPQKEAPAHTLALVEGEWKCMFDGRIDYYYNGLIEYDYVWYYIEDGQINWNYTGLVAYNGTFFYIENGILNWNYTGLSCYNGQWFYVTNGVIDWNYTGLVQYGTDWYYIQNGWMNPNYTGLVEYEGSWYYVQNSWMNPNYTGLVEYEGSWYYVQNSWMNPNYTGLVEYEGSWYYVQNSWMNPNYTGLVEYEGSWYYVQNSWMNPDYTGLVEYEGSWYYVQNSWMNPDYTGLVEYEGSWYYVQNSWMNPDYTGLVEYEGSWYYVQNSWMNPSYTGLVEYEGSWYYVQNSWMNPYYTGIVEYEGSLFYVANAWLNLDYNGIVEYDGKTYNVVNGVATLIPRPEGKEEILNVYSNLINEAKACQVGYKKVEYQLLLGDAENRVISKGEGLMGTVLSLVDDLGVMTSKGEAEASPEIVEQGSDMRWFPVYKQEKGCYLTDADALKDAKYEELGNGKARITIVLNDEVNPEPMVDGTGVFASNHGAVFSPLSRADIDEVLNDGEVNAVIKNVTYSLTYHDCTAIIEYDIATNQITRIEQQANITIEAYGKMMGMSELQIDKQELINTKVITDIQY